MLKLCLQKQKHNTYNSTKKNRRMNEEFKFLFTEDSNGQKVILNFDQIVGVREDGGGCYITTTSSQFTVYLSMTINEFYELLPSAIKPEDINR